MFEKEAKERARTLEERQTLGVYDNDEDLARDLGWNEGEVAGYEEGFKDGAQFGYNKCKEELNQNGLALQSDMDKTIEQNIALKKELNKANEWHYVKDELPDEGTYLVVWQNDKGYKEIFILYYEEYDEELHWVDDDCEVQDEYVIAWKEIVFPKEIEEND